MKFSIRLRIILLFIMSIILLTATFILFSYNQIDTIITDNIKSYNDSKSDLIIHDTKELIQEARDVSLLIIQNNHINETLKSTEKLDLKSEQSILQSLTSYINQKKNIHSITITNGNRTFRTSSLDHYFTANHIDKADNLKGKYFITSGQLTDSIYTEDVISLVRNLNDINDITNNLGVIYINLKKNAFINILDDTTKTYHGVFAIVADNNIIGRNADNQSEEFSIISDLITSGSVLPNRQFINYHFEANTFNIDDGITLIHVIDKNKIIDIMSIIRRALLISSLIGIIVTLILFFTFSRSVTGPLLRLKRFMEQIESQKFGITIEHNQKDEISIIYDAFNKMSNKLDLLLNQVYQKEIKRKEAELLSLQAQINPHFLYNTLDTIYWNARLEGAYKTSRLLHAFSAHFRHTLNEGHFYTSLSKEIHHIENYLLIQKERLDTLEYFIDNQAKDDYVVINHILQPIIENSIIHGFSSTMSAPQIRITIKAEKDQLVYIVADNGCGCDSDNITESIYQKKSKSYALSNIAERIKLSDKILYPIIVNSRSHKGTEVQIIQRIRTGANENV